jgi:hypothetical protein
MQLIGGPGFLSSLTCRVPVLWWGIRLVQAWREWECISHGNKRPLPNHIGSPLRIRKVICTKHLVQAASCPIATRQQFPERNAGELASNSASLLPFFETRPRKSTPFDKIVVRAVRLLRPELKLNTREGAGDAVPITHLS